MKKIILIVTIGLLILSCNKSDKLTKTECVLDNPIEDFAWLKAMKTNLTNCSCEISIIQGTYNNQTVFFEKLTDMLCDGVDMPTLYDCTGKVVRIFTSNDYKTFYNLVTDNKVLYRCKNEQ